MGIRLMMKKRLKFKGKRIYLSDLAAHPTEVYENKLYRWLSFGNKNIQTAISKQEPWQAVLNYIPALTHILPYLQATQGGLLLGLGGGALIHYLHHHHPSTTITAIEVDETIIDIAKHFFYLPEDPRLNIICDDASGYFERETTTFDFILCDIYSSDNFPEHCSSERFFQLGKSRISENGVFSINILAESAQQCATLLNMIQKTFNKQTLLVPVASSSNIILHAFKQRQTYNQITQALSKHKKVVWDAQWGMIVEL